MRWKKAYSVCAALMALLVAVVCAPAAGAQTFNILHAFTGGADGAEPEGLTLGADGRLYGAASAGGNDGISARGYCYQGCGTIYELSNARSGWHFAVLHRFTNSPDGAYPRASMTFGPDGSLYGTTGGGGGGTECTGGISCGGTIFELSSSSAACVGACRASETVLYRFTGGSAGYGPGFDAPIVFDRGGNIYGTTENGGYMEGECAGVYGCGVVFELMPKDSAWTENVLYSFGANAVGENPTAGVIFDPQGNLYGTTTASNVYQLVPSASGWTYNIILETPDTITAGVIRDQGGNLFGGSSNGGSSEGGTVFEISPQGSGWSNGAIYTFLNTSADSYYPGPAPTLLMDRSGNLYGTTVSDGIYGFGSVFELSPSAEVPGAYSYTDLHDFSGPDGQNPVAPLVIDSNGNIFGTTEFGGPTGWGIVFEITPAM